MKAPGGAGAPYLSADEIAAVVRRLGEEVSADHASGVVLIGILKGCSIFMADLLRTIRVPCSVDFLELSPYSEGGSRVRLAKDVEIDLAGQPTLIVVEIMDSGLTVNYVRRLLAERGAASTRVCALLDRSRRRVVPVEIDYKGAEIGDDYLVGYGLDLDEHYRDLPYLLTIDRHAKAVAADTGQDAGAKGDVPL